MTRLDELLADEFDSQEARLALELSREDQQLLAALVSHRKSLGLSQEDVAERLGLSQATISAFERIGNDPHLSTVRRYARAVGVMIRHHVDSEGDRCQDSQFLTHASTTGMTSHDTATALARAVVSSHAAAWPVESTAPKVHDKELV